MTFIEDPPPRISSTFFVILFDALGRFSSSRYLILPARKCLSPSLLRSLSTSRRQGLRRLRSWSQDALARSVDPAAGAANSSVDSTQNTLSRGSNEGAARRSDAASGGTQQQQRSSSSLKASGKRSPPATRGADVVSEPYLDDDETKPLIYGFLQKLGRNGHWQRRFFETNGERLTYYKSVKRTKVLATLDLCKVSPARSVSFFAFWW